MLHPIGNRRQFLKQTASLAVLSPFLQVACKRREVPPLPAGIQVFTPVQYHTLMKLMEVVVPPLPSLPSPFELQLPYRIDRFLRGEPAEIRNRIRDALLFVEWSPKLSRHFCRFSDLSLPERERFFARFAASPFRLKRIVYQGLKGLILFFYMDSPPVWPAIGYDGPWVK